jgi:hypothetical protein
MRYCLSCKEDVSNDGYNPNYYGAAIHHNYQDSYCGPVIVCDEAPSRHEVARLRRNAKARERYYQRRAWNEKEKLLKPNASALNGYSTLGLNR